MSDLIAITYADEASGRGAFEELDRLQKMEVLTLEDAALAIKDQKGKVKVKQTLENQHTGSLATWGFFWGFFIGLLFGGPLFWGLATALLGAIMGKSTDLGIDNKFIKEVGDSLEPGNSALCMLVLEAKRDEVIDELRQMGGTVFKTSLSREGEEKLRQALENDEVRRAAEDTFYPGVLNP